MSPTSPCSCTCHSKLSTVLTQMAKRSKLPQRLSSSLDTSKTSKEGYMQVRQKSTVCLKLGVTSQNVNLTSIFILLCIHYWPNDAWALTLRLSFNYNCAMSIRSLWFHSDGFWTGQSSRSGPWRPQGHRHVGQLHHRVLHRQRRPGQRLRLQRRQQLPAEVTHWVDLWSTSSNALLDQGSLLAEERVSRSRSQSECLVKTILVIYTIYLYIQVINTLTASNFFTEHAYHISEHL